MLEFEVNNVVCGITTCRPDWGVNERGTVFHRLYYVYEGNAYYVANCEQYPLKKNHLYLFPINTDYTIKHQSTNPLRCLWFHITTSPVICSHLIEVCIEKLPHMQYLLKSLEYIMKHCDYHTYNNTAINHILESIIILLSHEAKFCVISDQRIKKVLDYIHIHYNQKLTNAVLARVACFDTYYFVRLFKKHMGMTPQKYILNFRISKATTLLRQNHTVVQVAEKVGFDDPKSFSRAFKKAQGVPPSEYKNSHFLQP